MTLPAWVRWLAALLLALAPVAAHADERIRNFHSDVKIAKDGELTVTETITVAVEGNEIKRGIQRDFPTSYRNKLGQTTTVGFDVQSVTRDGQPESYTMIGMSNGERIRIGKADVMLDSGDHTYVITYTTNRQLFFTTDYDELYWNATGNGWTFPIDAASVRISLPEPAKFGQRAFYTGPQGATGPGDAIVSEEGPGFIAFRTTRGLGIGEGLTVAAAFPKGVVDAPAVTTRAAWWLRDWSTLAAGLIALVALLGYQLRAWLVAGRGPSPGTLVPRFTPPEGYSAAACRYIDRMDMDNRAFTAAIVECAVRRQLHIERTDGGWLTADTTTLTRTPGGTPVGVAEQGMLKELFEGGDTLTLKQSNYQTLQSARAKLGEVFERDYLNTLFRKNNDWAVWGLLGVPLAIMVVVAVSALTSGTGLRGLFGPISGMIAIGAMLLFWRLTKSKNGCVAAIFWIAMVFAGMQLMFSAFASVVLGVADGGAAVLLPLLALPVALLAFWWMAAPTAQGRAVMDQIDGFKHYLGITEEDRLDALHPPEKTPELFEKYLPYAIALDVENRWADKFTNVLAAAAATAGGAAAMSWYSGSGNVWDNPGDFVSGVGSSLDSTVSSASASPSSGGSGGGGGSSGGGSSGGGGGGGGGSGW